MVPNALAKDVKTGIQDNNYIEILSGVTVGEKVISAPFSAISKKLQDSTLIEIVKKEELYKVKINRESFQENDSMP